ncbi:MAG: DUF2520 domain-containing protein [Candidatus Polarisedimenticolia bacterium]
MAMKVAVIGAGRAGLGLALAMRARGVTLTGVIARRASGRAAARRLLGSRLVPASSPSALRRADVILLCVQDEAIVAAARALPPSLLEGKVVLHTSGATGAGALAFLRAHGARVGTLHPLTVFPPPSPMPPALDGVLFAIEGDPRARRDAAILARALGGHPVTVPARRRAAYHLSASLAANALVALLDAAIEVAVHGGGLTARDARRGLVTLADRSLAALRTHSPARALTGPIVRGDLGTVRLHLQALEAEDAALGALYRALACRAVRVAEADGRLARTRAARLRRLLRCAAIGLAARRRRRIR